MQKVFFLPPFPQWWPCFSTDQNFANNFWKGSSRNNPGKLFQNLTSSFREEEFLVSPHSEKSLPPHGRHVSWNFANNFWKGVPKEYSYEIFSKSDQGFQRTRFFMNFFRSIWCKMSPSPMVAMFFHGSKLCEQFLKRVTQGIILWNIFKISQVVSEEKNFKEFLWSPHSAKNPPPPSQQPCFLKDQNFAHNFWKGSQKKQSYEIISKSDQRFQRWGLLKNSFRNFIWLPWQPEFLLESNFANIFQRGQPCQVWFKLAQQLRRRWCLKKLLTTDDRHRVILKTPFKHVALRWA